jgi:hypothetical protein
MPVLFSDESGRDTAGRLVILAGDDTQLPQFVTIANIADGSNQPEQTGLVILGGGGGYAAAAQIQPTLGNTLYSFGFGRRPGEFNVSGAAFSEICGSNVESNTVGLKRLLDFYEKYNRGVYREPLALTLQPGVVRDGMLDQLRWRYANPAMRMIEFDISLVLLP